MNWPYNFHSNEMLLLRPIVVTICLDCEPAAKLLSILMYRQAIGMDSQQDTRNWNERARRKGGATQDISSIRIPRKQDQFLRDSAYTLTKQTIIQVATPLLQLLGFLSVDDTDPVIIYELNTERIQAALDSAAINRYQEWIAENINLETLREAFKKFLIVNKRVASKIFAAKGQTSADTEIDVVQNSESPVQKFESGSSKILTSDNSAQVSPEAPREAHLKITKKKRENKENNKIASAIDIPLGELEKSSSHTREDQKQIALVEDLKLHSAIPTHTPDKKSSLSPAAQRFLILWESVLGKNRRMYQRWNAIAVALEKLSSHISDENSLRSLVRYAKEHDKNNYFEKNPMMPHQIADFYLDDWLQVQHVKALTPNLHERREREWREQFRQSEEKASSGTRDLTLADRRAMLCAIGQQRRDDIRRAREERDQQKNQESA